MEVVTLQLYNFQLEALGKIKNGCILNGGVGSGKSITSLAYYYLQQGGSFNFLNGGEFKPMSKKKIQDLYIITPAQKRDIGEWEDEMIPFYISSDDDLSLYPDHKVVIDSWNNIKKYKDVKNAFFIFDEDRVTGSGVWVKTFLKIAKVNNWIILSATPGDTYMDYWAVFVANGFYRNKTDFTRQHVVYSRFTKYPKVDKFVNTKKLAFYRDRILIPMGVERNTIQHHENIYCTFDRKKYKEVMKNRWDIYKNEPIQQASSLCYVLRRVVNEDGSRIEEVKKIVKKHPKIIIFYNFDYERDILLKCDYGKKYKIAEWSGHAHQDIPKSDEWVYLVQYAAGNSAWNCIKTNAIIFYSQNYSYKVLHQSCGRIDRLNTPYKNLYYYHLKSKASIDLAINRALKQKKQFNERKFGGF